MAAKTPNVFVIPNAPAPGEKCRVYIQRTYYQGKSFGTGWHVAHVVEHHRGEYRDGITVKTRDGAEWRWCSVDCVRPY